MLDESRLTVTPATPDIIYVKGTQRIANKIASTHTTSNPNHKPQKVHLVYKQNSTKGSNHTTPRNQGSTLNAMHKVSSWCTKVSPHRSYWQTLPLVRNIDEGGLPICAFKYADGHPLSYDLSNNDESTALPYPYTRDSVQILVVGER
jgi:hypothetical protein